MIKKKHIYPVGMTIAFLSALHIGLYIFVMAGLEQPLIRPWGESIYLLALCTIGVLLIIASIVGIIRVWNPSK